jgi:hypothetical protein
MMTQAQHNEVRDRSYSVPPSSSICASGQGLIHPGDEATIRYSYGPLGAGSIVRVHSFTNAGFRGIEAYVITEDNRRLNVSAGNLDPVTLPSCDFCQTTGHDVTECPNIDEEQLDEELERRAGCTDSPACAATGCADCERSYGPRR